MWLAAELVVVAWIVGGGWLALRRGPADGLSRILGFFIAYLAAAASLWLADACLARLHGNLWMRAVVAIAVGLVASCAAWWWWFRSARAPAPRLAAWLRARMPRSFAAMAVAVIAVAWTAIHGAAWTVVVNVAAAGSHEQELAIRRQTLVSSALLGRRLDQAPAGTDRGQPHDQARALDRMRDGFTRGVDGVLDASGAGRVMDAMDALRALMRLDDDERARLAETIPEIQRLTEDPLVLAIVDDQRLMERVREAGGGSLSAIYDLGDEPRIQALVEDPGMRAAVAAVDLASIRDRLRGRERGALDPMRWELATIASSLDFDRRLAEPEGWLASTTSVLVWPAGKRFAIARTRIATAESKTDRQLRVRGGGELSCWIDRAACPPRRDGAARVIALPEGGGDLVLLFDTGASRTASACTIEFTEAVRPP